MSERYVITPCCSAAVDVYCSSPEWIECPNCKRRYDVREDIDFAQWSTGSTEFYRWAEDGSHIVKFYFHNMTLDEIEGVAERIKTFSPREQRPLVLLPIFKALYDCLRKRLQQHLVYDRVPNLTALQKAQIEEDLPFPGNNLAKLFDFLSVAYPSEQSRILALRDSQSAKLLLWIRNKEEHIAIAAWPLPSYVHTDKGKLPSDPSRAVAILGVPLAVEVNGFVVDVLKCIYDLDPEDVQGWHYEQIERFRIKATV